MKERGLWFLFLVAGLVVLPLLALHMAVMHLDGTLAVGNPAGGHENEITGSVEAN